MDSDAAAGGLKIGCGFAVAIVVYSLMVIPLGPTAIIVGMVVLGAIGVLAAAIWGFSRGVKIPENRRGIVVSHGERIPGRVVVVVNADTSETNRSTY